MFLTIGIDDIPEYLHKSEFYRSLDLNNLNDDCKKKYIDVPVNCFKPDDTIGNFDELLYYLYTCRFWGIEKFSSSFFEYILGNSSPNKQENVLSDIQCNFLCGTFPELLVLNGLHSIQKSKEKDLIAAKYDNIYIFKYLYESSHELDKEIDKKVKEYGSILCLKYLVSVNKTDRGAIFDTAIKYGHVHILEWLKKSEYSFEYADDTIDLVCKFGHVKVLEWFKENSQYEFKYSKWAVNLASGCGHVVILEWFLSNSQYEFKYDNWAVDLACKFGHIGVLEWFKENFQYEFKYSSYAIYYANLNNHICVLNWFLSNPQYKYQMQSWLCIYFPRIFELDKLNTMQ